MLTGPVIEKDKCGVKKDYLLLFSEQNATNRAAHVPLFPAAALVLDFEVAIRHYMSST